MKPDNHGPNDEPQSEEEKPTESSTQDSIRDGAKNAPVAKNPSGQKTGKPKANALMEEVRQTLQKKALEAAIDLKPVMLEDKINEAVESIVSRIAHDLNKAAINYIRKSAAAYKITKSDLMDELIAINKLKPSRRTQRPKSEKMRDAKNSKGRPDAN